MKAKVSSAERLEANATIALKYAGWSDPNPIMILDVMELAGKAGVFDPMQIYTMMLRIMNA